MYVKINNVLIRLDSIALILMDNDKELHITLKSGYTFPCYVDNAKEIFEKISEVCVNLY